MRKQFFSLLLILALLPALPAQGADETFTDVSADFWAYEPIHWAYRNGYMNGYSATTFVPDGVVSRQALWMVLARLSGSFPTNMEAARLWAVNHRISDGSRPEAAVSRQQLVTMLYRYALQKEKDVTGVRGERGELDAYSDSGAIAPYAVEALSWAVGSRVMTGVAPNLLLPDGTASRAQFAVILYRFFAALSL